LTPPYLILHREEFAWPRLSPNAPVRSYIKPRGAAPFHPSSRRVGTGLLSVALVVVRLISDYKFQSAGWCYRKRYPFREFENCNLRFIRRPAVSGLAALWCSDFPLLTFSQAGSKT